MNVSLPECLKEYVRQRVEQGNFGSPGEYIRCLIRRDMEREAREHLGGLLLEGMASGPSRQVDEAYWDEKRRHLDTAT